MIKLFFFYFFASLDKEKRRLAISIKYHRQQLNVIYMMMMMMLRMNNMQLHYHEHNVKPSRRQIKKRTRKLSMMIKFVMFNGTSVINSSRIYINSIFMPPMQWLFLLLFSYQCVRVCVWSLYLVSLPMTMFDDDVYVVVLVVEEGMKKINFYVDQLITVN